MLGEALARGLIRLLVTVGILLAVYLLLVRPILDTTTNTIEQAFDGPAGVTNQIEGLLDSAGVSGLDIDLDSESEAQRLLRCVQRANQDVSRIQRCSERFSP